MQRSTLDNQKHVRHNTARLSYLRIHTPTSGIGELLFLSGVMTFLLALFTVIGCADGTRPYDSTSSQSPSIGQGGSMCEASEARYPTTEDQFSDDYLLYGHRGFLDSYQGVLHLGRDMTIPEGSPIFPIACGTIRVFRPSQGYGTLVVVIEHTLPQPINIINGDGEMVSVANFLSIYGHLRKTQQSNGGDDVDYVEGATVQPWDVIGYVQNDSQNGDGPEHVHVGIRLQSASAAMQTDPSAWFRGNDTPGEGTYKKYYTDPATFIPALQDSLNDEDSNSMQPQVSYALHHPIGTILEDVNEHSEWMVVENDSIINVGGYSKLPRKCSVLVPSQTLSCYRKLAFHPFSLELDAPVVKFLGSSEVYKLYPSAGFAASAYQAFLSYDAFLSWGYTDQSVQVYAESERQQVLGGLEQKNLLGFMPGSLVKGSGQSEIAIANQNGERLPIFNWDVFNELGYSAECIYEIEPSTLDVVAGTKSIDTLTMSDTQICATESGAQICTPGNSVDCLCPNGDVSVQKCNDQGTAYDACICTSGGPGGSGCDPYTSRTCVCDDQQNSGTQYCDAQGEWSICLPCDQSSGSGGTSGSGGSSGTGGTSGTGGVSGSGGSTSSEYYVEIEFDAPSYSISEPIMMVGWLGDGVQELGCQLLAVRKVLCTYQMTGESQVSSIEGQVQLTDYGVNDLYWGDASGNSYSACLTQAEIDAMHSDCLTINGTVCMRVNGQPHNMQPCDNGYPKAGSCADCCQESPIKPYFNFCAD